MKPTHIEHLGIAVKNLDESIKYYQDVLGLECYNIEEVKDQKVRTAFFKLPVHSCNRRDGHAIFFSCRLYPFGKDVKRI